MGRLVTFEPFIESLEEFVTGTKKAIEKKATDLALKVFDELVEKSPQFTGDFVANYRIGVKKYHTVTRNARYRPQDFQGQEMDFENNRIQVSARQMGSPEAINFAKGNARRSVKRFVLGADLYIYNYTPFDGLDKKGENSRVQAGDLVEYFRKLNVNSEALSKQIRPVNLIGGQVILLEHILAKYL